MVTNQLKIEQTAAELAHKVAPIYQFLQWKWKWHREDFNGIPTEDIIKSELIELAGSLNGKPIGSSMTSGGLRVETYKDEMGCNIMHMEFNIYREIMLT